MAYVAPMIYRPHRPLSRGLGAALLTVTLLAAACGDDSEDNDDASTDTTAADEAAGDEAGSDEAEAEDNQDGSDAGSAEAATSGFCDLVPAEEVAAAAGVEVSETTETTGTGSYQEIDYSTVGCTYEVAEGGNISISGLTDDMGTQLDSAILGELMTASEASSFDDFPHEEVDGLGEGAFFQAGLGPPNRLFVDASPSPVLVIQNHRDLPMERESLQAVAEVAVENYN